MSSAQPIGDEQSAETQEWLDALEYVLRADGPERAIELVEELQKKLRYRGVMVPFPLTTPYVNTIQHNQQPPYPGHREIERRIKSLVRWNAMAMVVRANKESSGIGGHISTYASAATLYEVGFNHFFRGKDGDGPYDQIYFQGHATPGVYARAYLEGRITEDQLSAFRRELKPGGGLSSYPHPWLMPEFWEFPTVSMGLGPIMSIYQARFNHYLTDRGVKDVSGNKVWCFVGDGESDEPESLGALTLAAREKLDNLVWVVNCNLQRLDGPVRGNGKIIQELEAAFRGAGWNVIKVVWGDDWDPLLAMDREGWLVRRMEECVDGDYQKYSVETGEYIREHFFGKYPELKKMVANMSDEQLSKMRRGGHDPEKIYAAFKAASEHKGGPTVILAKTVKGYGMGEAGEGKNITHSQKKLNEEELRQFRSRFGIPIGDDDIAEAPFYRPDDDSPEVSYLKKRREELGGSVPKRKSEFQPLDLPAKDVYQEFLEGTADREVSTTMAFARLFSKLIKDKGIGKYVVPIIPDEARTFGLEPLFRQAGIYSHMGQLYEPVDRDTLLYYRESTDGQILEEGITEAGAMSSFVAAGTAYATHSVPMMPFFIYYSMFGMQRIGDLVWAAAEMRAKGFMVGGTAGRTTLAGEGLQHQDGHSHVLASTVPSLKTYDPAWAFELALIIRDGIKRMYEDKEDGFYYVTIGNENYAMPKIPDGEDVEEGVIRGMYLYQRGRVDSPEATVALFGSGAILREVLRAQEILAEKFNVSGNVYSVTSYNELRRDAVSVERWNMLHPEDQPRVSYIQQVLEKSQEQGPYVAASDYMKVVSDQIAKFLPGPLLSLGTDGFGRSEDRPSLRRHFEVDAEHIAVAALYALSKEGKIDAAQVTSAIKELGVDPEAIEARYA